MNTSSTLQSTCGATRWPQSVGVSVQILARVTLPSHACYMLSPAHIMLHRMILMLFEEQHRRESPHNARLSVFCLRHKQSPILPVCVSFEGSSRTNGLILQFKFLSLEAHSGVWTTVLCRIHCANRKPAEIHLFKHSTVRLQWHWSGEFCFYDLLYPLSLPGPFLSLLLCHELPRQIYLAGAVCGVCEGGRLRWWLIDKGTILAASSIV